jgi:ubiquinone/menaquinone biosynthesis C-methylase UbiE
MLVYGNCKNRKKMKSILLPFDIFERHKNVARLIKPGETILDIGGGVDALALFVRNKVVVSNLKDGDVLADGRALPFDKESFDVVTSIDVIEHIPPQDRGKFMNELLKVAKRKVVISAPLGTREHLQSEKNLLKFLKSKKVKVDYLNEHVKQGLPTVDELKTDIKDFSVKVFYSGDFRLNRFLTVMDVTSFKNPYFDKLFYFLKRLVNISLNIFYFPFSRSKKPNFFTNRVYLYVEK